ncbi:MAG: hypothetical protein F4035_02790, partial [Acidimicrobiia bacterium]|nr:hypothetical protein [Acidimicrobiia bacterium]
MRELPTNPRRLADGDLPLAIGPVRVPEYSGSQVISVHRGLITGIEPFPNGSEAPVPEPSHLAMPSFAEPHLH